MVRKHVTALIFISYSASSEELPFQQPPKNILFIIEPILPNSDRCTSHSQNEFSLAKHALKEILTSNTVLLLVSLQLTLTYACKSTARHIAMKGLFFHMDSHMSI